MNFINFQIVNFFVSVKKFSFLFIFSFGIFLFYPAVVQAAYDLEVTGISVSPAKPPLNILTTITVTVKNTDVEPLTDLTGIDSYNINFQNFELSSVTLPTITAAKPVAYNATFKYIIKGIFDEIGTSRLTFQVNSDQALTERTYTNNNKSVSVEVVPAHDLLVSSIKSSMTGLSEGQETTITVKVQNNGYLDLINNFGIRSYTYEFQDFVEKSKTIPNISISAPLLKKAYAEYIFVGYFTGEGEKVLKFTADQEDQLDEFDEANNKKEAIISVGSEDDIDLAVTSISLSKDLNKLIVDDDITITVLVKNTGGISLLDAKGLLERDYGYATGGDLLYSFPGIEITEIIHGTYPDTDNPLNPNETISYKFLGTIKDAGIHELSFRADIHGDLTETNEENNSINKTITVYKSLEDMYDFDISDVKCSTISSSSLQIIWSTNKESDGYIMYKEKGDAKYLSIGKDALAASHSVTIEKLAAGIYEFYAYSKSSPGTVFKSDTGTFTVLGGDEEGGSQTGISNTTQTQTETQNQNKESISASVQIKNQNMYQNLRGKIILKVESKGEAYYVNPASETMYYLGRPQDAFAVMRQQGVGISSVNLDKIKIGIASLSGVDADGDGLSDIFEDAIGTDKNKKDTDSDGFGDKQEVEDGYNPLGAGKINTDINFASTHKGKIFLQVEGKGEAWYVNPRDGKRYFLGRPADAFAVMRNLGLGISNSNFDSL